MIAPLSRGLVKVTGAIRLAPGSRLLAVYGASGAVEAYHRRHGLSPRHAGRLDAGPLRAAALDAAAARFRAGARERG